MKPLPLGVAALWLALAAQGVSGQGIRMDWGLENRWAYEETKRAEDEDGAVTSASPKTYRAFAFRDRVAEVRDPFLNCLDSHQRAWDAYRRGQKDGSIPADPAGGAVDADAARLRFGAYAAARDPGCAALFGRQAPQLYFDFLAGTAAQVVLERIEVRTVAFSEYMGGGVVQGQTAYDVLLSHVPGTRVLTPEPRLVFEKVGRVTLRLWSDNFYPNVGWMAPMGEYTLEITFVFSSGGREFRVSTGAFKIDV